MIESTNVSVQLSTELARKLRLASEASGAPRTRIIRAALDVYIDATLQQNDDIRARFERFANEEAAREAAPAVRHLRVIK